MARSLWLVECMVFDGYDTYSDFVCVAASEEHARKIHPCGMATWKNDAWNMHVVPSEGFYKGLYLWSTKDDDEEWVLTHNREKVKNSWTTPDRVKVEWLGWARADIAESVICASYHAG